MHVLKLGTPQHLEMCQMKIIYRTFHILEIRVWVSTEGVSTKGVFVFSFFFFGFGFCFFSFYLSPGLLTIYINHPGGNKLCICCGSILSLVQIFFSFVFGYGNV